MHKLTQAMIDYAKKHNTVYSPRCSHCGKVLDPEMATWLEMSIDLEFALPGEAPWSDTDESQGCFVFGPDCGPKVLKTQVCNWKDRY